MNSHNDYKLKVTYESKYKVKEGRKWVTKVSQFEEMHRSEADARLRALALNWTIVLIRERGKSCLIHMM